MTVHYKDFVESLTKQEYADTAGRLLASGVGKLLHAAVGVSGESGELLDAVKKYLFYGSPLDVENVVEELGDILFYTTMACNALGIPLETVVQRNVHKLSKRYPSGSFSEQDARERADKNEDTTDDLKNE